MLLAQVVFACAFAFSQPGVQHLLPVSPLAAAGLSHETALLLVAPRPLACTSLQGPMLHKTLLPTVSPYACACVCPQPSLSHHLPWAVALLLSVGWQSLHTTAWSQALDRDVMPPSIHLTSSVLGPQPPADFSQLTSIMQW